MNNFINVVLLILILFTLFYFNVLEAYTAHTTNALSTTSIAIENGSSGCKRGNREQQPQHNVSNHSKLNNCYLIGNNIKGCL